MRVNGDFKFCAPYFKEDGELAEGVFSWGGNATYLIKKDGIYYQNYGFRNFFDEKGLYYMEVDTFTPLGICRDKVLLTFSELGNKFPFAYNVWFPLFITGLDVAKVSIIANSGDVRFSDSYGDWVFSKELFANYTIISSETYDKYNEQRRSILGDLKLEEAPYQSAFLRPVGRISFFVPTWYSNNGSSVRIGLSTNGEPFIEHYCERKNVYHVVSKIVDIEYHPQLLKMWDEGLYSIDMMMEREKRFNARYTEY